MALKLRMENASYYFTLKNRDWKNYPVTFMGHVMYESTNINFYGYYYNNHAWTDLAYANHLVNR